MNATKVKKLKKNFFSQSTNQSDMKFSTSEISIILLVIIFLIALLFWSPTTEITN